MNENSLQAVIGFNFARIRTDHGLTQSQVASHARRIGLPWTPSKCGDFESGRNRVYADVLAMALLALDNALGEAPGPAATLRADGTVTRRKRDRVTLPDLVRHDGFVTVADGFEPKGEKLAAVFSGRTWELDASDTAETADVGALLEPAPGLLGERYRMRVFDVADMRRRSTRAEARVCERLGIDSDHLLGLSWRLWKRPFNEERDSRAQPNRGSRARTAQTLTTELQAELWKESNRGDN